MTVCRYGSKFSSEIQLYIEINIRWEQYEWGDTVGTKQQITIPDSVHTER